MVDLHRHDEHSSYDGFGKAGVLARIAMAKGHSSFATSNHGTTSGLAEHYFACKDAGIKPIMGVEVYFQPKFDRNKNSRFHLCLYCVNLKGYQNLNRLVTKANLEQFYYKPIVDFDLLEEFSEGIVCTSACVAGFLSQMLLKDKVGLVLKAAERFKKIFGNRFYIEIQPYEISEAGMQEKVNVALMKLADGLGIKCILTSDSHYGSKEEFPTYLKMHEMAGHDLEQIRDTYSERYMPTEEELVARFVQMHRKDFPDIRHRVQKMMRNLNKLEERFEADILDQLPLKLPNLHGESSVKVFRRNIIKGLKAKGKYEKRYIERVKREAEVIEHLGFVDYFLIVQDYVKWAKDHNVMVGPGRGSVCNCLIAFALDITNIDSLYFDLDFDRFMRKDKKKVPDVDLDFETDRRHEVIQYIISKYPGSSAQVVSYGLYKADNLLNNLFKVCGVEAPSDKAAIKTYVKANIDEEIFAYDDIKATKECRMWNKQYDNIIEHFSRLYKQLRFYGTHAAGVAITGTDLQDYTALEKRGDKIVTAYDLGNLELIHVVKFDILGLRTMSTVKELQELTGKYFKYSWCEDKKILEQFRLGNTNGIFQFETTGSQAILRQIDADCMEDVLAGSALNRPGPLSIRMPEAYGHNKFNLQDVKKSPWYKYSKETYGTIVYQEQIVRICREIGRYEWSEVDRILKVLKGRGRAIKFRDREIAELRVIFYKGAKAGGYSKQEAEKIFNILLIYSFNKGHAAGYAVVSLIQMFYKVYYPELFWYITLKYAKEEDIFKFQVQAVKGGSIIMLPHVNYSAKYSLQKLDGDRVIAEGLMNIKNVGEKAATAIETERKANGPFKDMDDFLDRVPGRLVNVRVLNALKEAGALEFNKRRYIERVKKYNSTLYAKGLRG